LPSADHQRFVLLNRLLSKSIAKAPEEHRPASMKGEALLQTIAKRRTHGVAIEFLGMRETERDSERSEEDRIEAGHGYNFVSLRQIKFEESDTRKYAILLFELVDQDRRSFSVVNTRTHAGREISGEDDERGGISAHMVVRLPKGGFDDGSYRCTIEVAPSLTRSEIEQFLCRQLRRQAAAEDWTFTARVSDKKTGKLLDREYHFHPRLELVADIGRKISFTLAGGREVARMKFIKRSERHSIGQPSAIEHEEFVADVVHTVKASQGPEDPDRRQTWLQQVWNHFVKERGFEVKLVYKNLEGGTVTGNVHQALAGATDLVMCQRELISLSKPPRDWHSRINAEIVGHMVALLDRDELWERTK
jgi:hypothetical protein